MFDWVDISMPAASRQPGLAGRASRAEGMRSAVVYNLGDEGTAAAPLHSFHIAMKARKAADCYPKKVSIRSARYGRGPVSGVLAGGAGFLPFLGEDALPVPVQGVEVDVLDGQGVLVVAVELAASLGAACVDPVRGPVAGAVEPGCLGEGPGEDGGVAVGVLPVGGQPAGDPAQDRGGEVRDADVGQDEEAGVVGDEGQPGFAGGGVPADAGVEPERGDGAGPVGLGQVAELGSGERGAAGVVAGGGAGVPGPGGRAGGGRPGGQGGGGGRGG